MVHGIASSSVTFERLVPLVEPFHRVIAIDLLGFGESPMPEDAEYTIDEHTAALARTIRSLRLREPFVLVGHSLGALIATRYAATHAGKVSKVDPGQPADLPPGRHDQRRRAVARRMGLYFRTYEYLRENKDFTIRAAARAGAALADQEPPRRLGAQLARVRAVAAELDRDADHAERPRRDPGPRRAGLRIARPAARAGRHQDRGAAAPRHGRTGSTAATTSSGRAWPGSSRPP